jgi:hypothetical protein
MVSPVANGTIILPTRQVLMSAPSILRRPCHLAADGLGPVGVVFSKLSKLLNHEDALSAPCSYSTSQLLWRDKGRFGLHQLRNCLRGDFCSPQARPRWALHGQPGQAECCGKA